VSPAGRARRSPTRTGRSPARTSLDTLADVVVVALVAVTDLDAGRLGLSSDAMRWLLLAPLWLAPLGLLAWSPDVVRDLARPPARWLFAWAAVAAVSVLWSVESRPAVLVGLSFLGSAVLVVWYVGRAGWDRFLRLAVAGGTGYLVVCFIAELTWVDEPRAGGRLIGLSFSPTSIGTTATMIGVAAIVLADRTRTWRWLLVVGPVVTVAEVWADSRGATLALVVAAAWVLTRDRARLRLVVVVTAAVLAVLVVVTYASGDEAALTRSGQASEATSLTGRTDVWPEALRFIGERPVLGWGAGTSSDLYASLVWQGRLWWFAYDSHQMFLSVALETGIVGLALFGGGLTAVALARRRARGAEAIVLAIVVNGLTDSFMVRPSVLWLLLVGAASAASVAARPQRVRATLLSSSSGGGLAARAAPRPAMAATSAAVSSSTGR
jgi:O-antigen ligase